MWACYGLWLLPKKLFLFGLLSTDCSPQESTKLLAGTCLCMNSPWPAASFTMKDHLLQQEGSSLCGSLDVCSTTVLSMSCAGICSSIWSISSQSFFTDLGDYGIVSLAFFSSQLVYSVFSLFLKYSSTEEGVGLFWSQLGVSLSSMVAAPGLFSQWPSPAVSWDIKTLTYKPSRMSHSSASQMSPGHYYGIISSVWLLKILLACLIFGGS